MDFFLSLKSDFRSSFKVLEKSIFEKKLVTYSWIKALQIYRINIEFTTDFSSVLIKEMGSFETKNNPKIALTFGLHS
jgi:hypothetical protein